MAKSHTTANDRKEMKILTNFKDYPPGGYPYREPSISWVAPRELALQGFDAVVNALSVARSQNPASGLDSSIAACALAVSLYTCARLKSNKRLLATFCGEPETVQPQESSAIPMRTSIIKRKKKCGSCGKQR